MIVLTLRGLDTGREDRMADFLKGFARGRQRVVDYGDSLMDSLDKGADILDEHIRAALAVDEVTVMGHSRGSTVCGTWLQKYANRTAAPCPVKLRFILLGNPNRRLGGDGTRTPDTTQYRVDDVTRRWDRWSNRDNWPDKAGGSWFRLWIGSMVDHGAYENVDLATARLRQQIGNTKYWVAP
jgi:pimeloyl-ACP methyl ester carboxylesterase